MTLTDLAPALRTPVASSPDQLHGLLSTARPQQWVKNLLVLAAPVAALALGSASAIERSLLAVLAFCLMSSAGYLVNDLLDLDADRAHPVKRHRALAAGRVSVPAALTGAAVLVLASLGTAASVNTPLLLLTSAYGVLTVSYSTVLKHIAPLDLAAVSTCFLLRALAGAAAVQVDVSPWFFAAAMAGALLLATGKRESELRLRGAGSTRRVLSQYSVRFLVQLRSLASTGLLVVYCLWAFDGRTGAPETLLLLAALPLAVAVLRFGALTAQAAAEAPESVLVSDQVLRSTATLAVVLVGAGLYLPL